MLTGVTPGKEKEARKQSGKSKSRKARTTQQSVSMMVSNPMTVFSEDNNVVRYIAHWPSWNGGCVRNVPWYTCSVSQIMPEEENAPVGFFLISLNIYIILYIKSIYVKLYLLKK